MENMRKRKKKKTEKKLGKNVKKKLKMVKNWGKTPKIM